MATVKTKPLRLVVTDKGRSDINALAARIIAEMNRAGISADGTPFKKGKGKKTGLTMEDSGRLHRDFEAYTTRIQWKAPYADVLQKLFHWAGLPASGPWREKFNAGVQQILNKELRAD